MATTPEYIKHVCYQIKSTKEVRYRKMFGEYMVYVDDRPLIIVCDNVPFVKKLDCLDNLMQSASTGYPYEGAKEHYILDIDNAALCESVIKELEKVIPKPKKKK